MAYKNIKSDYTFIYQWNVNEDVCLMELLNATSCDEATKWFVNYQNNEVSELTDVNDRKQLSFYKCIRGIATPEEFSEIRKGVWEKDFLERTTPC